MKKTKYKWKPKTKKWKLHTTYGFISLFIFSYFHLFYFIFICFILYLFRSKLIRAYIYIYIFFFCFRNIFVGLNKLIKRRKKCWPHLVSHVWCTLRASPVWFPLPFQAQVRVVSREARAWGPGMLPRSGAMGFAFFSRNATGSNRGFGCSLWDVTPQTLNQL